MLKKILGRLEEDIICLLLVSMTLLVVLDVVMRFGFSMGFHWMAELTLTIAGWFVLFGMSYGVKVGAHIGVDAFVNMLPPTARKISSLAAIFICMVYCAMFLYGSWVYIAKMYTFGMTMEDLYLPEFFTAMLSDDIAWDVLKIDVEERLIPAWMVQSILLFGFALLMLRFVELFIKVAKDKAVGFKLADEAKESMHLAQHNDEDNK